jgi:hypothetical protein
VRVCLSLYVCGKSLQCGVCCKGELAMMAKASPPCAESSSDNKHDNGTAYTYVDDEKGRTGGRPFFLL